MCSMESDRAKTSNSLRTMKMSAISAIDATGTTKQLVFAGLVILAVMGVALYAVFAALEQRMSFWAQTRPDEVQWASSGPSSSETFRRLQPPVTWRLCVFV